MTVGPGTKVVIPEPTFTLYALMTTILGGEPVRVPCSASRQPWTRPSPADGQGRVRDFRYDVEALLAARRASGASVTIVCSPNNPTGTSLALADVERLCRAERRASS